MQNDVQRGSERLSGDRNRKSPAWGVCGVHTEGSGRANTPQPLEALSGSTACIPADIESHCVLVYWRRPNGLYVGSRLHSCRADKIVFCKRHLEPALNGSEFPTQFAQESSWYRNKYLHRARRFLPIPSLGVRGSRDSRDLGLVAMRSSPKKRGKNSAEEPNFRILRPTRLSFPEGSLSFMLNPRHQSPKQTKPVLGNALHVDATCSTRKPGQGRGMEPL